MGGFPTVDGNPSSLLGTSAGTGCNAKGAEEDAKDKDDEEGDEGGDGEDDEDVIH